MSLPVIVFKKESHLTSFARLCSYLPLFFDKPYLNSLERVKYATLFTISRCNLIIANLKPFNPILGETLQVWVGGCPLYLQQIIHHPPISSYYMLGKGYKSYGTMSPKMNFGLNNVKAFMSTNPHYLTFDDGTQIEMNNGKMVVGGIIFGERDFNYV